MYKEAGVADALNLGRRLTSKARRVYRSLTGASRDDLDPDGDKEQERRRRRMEELRARGFGERSGRSTPDDFYPDSLRG